MTKAVRRRCSGSAASFVLVFVLFLTGCPLTERQGISSPAPPDDLQVKVRRLEQLVAELQRSARPREPDAELSRRLDRMGKEMGDLRARVDAMEEQSRKVADMDQRAEQARRSSEQARSEAVRVEDDLTKQLASLARKVADLEGRVRNYVAEAVAPRGPAAAPERASAVAPADRKPTAQSLYDDGYNLYKDRKYPEAREKFREYLRLYPDTPLADNAQFWIGETHFYQAQAEKDPTQYEKAILEYDKVVQQYPKGNKVPSALLKQALAFKAIDDPVDARILLRKILREYPNSDPAKIAEGELKNLGE